MNAPIDTTPPVGGIGYQDGKPIQSTVLPGSYELSSQNQQSGTDTTVPSTVSTGDLAQPNTSVPNYTPSTSATGLSAYITSINSDYNKNRQTEIDTLKDTSKNDLSDIEKLSNQLGESGNMREGLYKEGGVDTAKEHADALASQIDAEQLATRHQVEALTKNNPQGLFGGALEDEVNRIQRESASKQADLSVVQSMWQNKYSTAQSIAERKLSAELEPMKTRLDTLKFIYGENKDKLTKSEDRQYKEKIDAEDRAYKEQYDDRKRLQDLKFDLLKTAITKGLPLNTQISIQNAGNEKDLSKISIANGIKSIKFSTTQLNKGASNAGLPIASFQSLDPDVKNFFVNPPAANVPAGSPKMSMPKMFNFLLDSVQSGDTTLEQANSYIDQSDLPASVKTYFKQKLPAGSAATPQKSGWLQGIGNFFKGLVN